MYNLLLLQTIKEQADKIALIHGQMIKESAPPSVCIVTYNIMKKFYIAKMQF